MMRNISLFFLIAFFIAVGVFASAKGVIKDKHAGKEGLNGDPVNCGYCHGKNKANNPKTMGNDLAKLKQGKYCAIKDCH